MENSKIEWTHHTFNPWIGCAKVSAGCKHCYAETLMDTRYGRVEWGVNGTRSRTSEAYWRKPLAWNGHAKATGQRLRVFCASLADVFEDRPDLVEWRADLFKLIDVTPYLDWLLLTKRPENIARLMVEAKELRIRDNVWLGTSVEDQDAANERIPHLLKAAHLARFTFLSCEPLIGPVDIAPLYTSLPGSRNIDWIIAGGESGQGARPMHPDWARQLRDIAACEGIAFLFKQWGEFEFLTDIEGRQHAPFGGQMAKRVGKHASGRMLDGVEHNGFPG